MSKKKLLEEGTVRQFMKLANLKPLASTFINETYGEELDATIDEIGMFGRLKNQLTGQTSETSSLASKIWSWVKENDLIGEFGETGQSSAGLKGSWNSQQEVFDWAQDNFEKAKALSSTILVGAPAKGFEDVPVVRDAAHLDSLEPYKSEKERASDAKYTAKAQQDKESDLAMRNSKVEKSIADKAAAKKQEEEEMESFRTNQAGRKAQIARDERDRAETKRQKERNAVRYGPQGEDAERQGLFRENMKITKSQLKHIIKEELTQVLNEMEALAPEVAGFVEKAITALTVLKKVGSDMGKYKGWAQDNLAGENALEGLLNADSADAVKDAARMMYRHYTRGIDFEGMAQAVQSMEAQGKTIADHRDADEIIPSLKAKPLLDKLAAILSNP